MLRDDFCVFILSHGRPDSMYTYHSLVNAGYTGKVYIIIDDQDKTAGRYKKIFCDKVLVFDKEHYASILDEGDNTGKRISTIYARAAMFDLAKDLGIKYFIQLDDDYLDFEIRFKSDGTPTYIRVNKYINDILEAMLDFYISIPALSVAMAQGGDFIGGGKVDRQLKRKAMNSFICDVDKRWVMFGRMNEDVNTYVTESRRGKLFFTVMQAKLTQRNTQATDGGMTDLYLDSGTYVKTFYSIMYAPSCVKIGTMCDPRGSAYRIHHRINWNYTAPKILREELKKP